MTLEASSASAGAMDEWRRNWPVVLAGALGMAIGSLHAYSLGVMVIPLEEEFGWKRAQISSGLLITSTMAVMFAPFMGMAIDRLGTRIIATVGVTLFCVALALLSQASGEIISWYLLWGFLGVALLHIKATVWVAAVTRVFEKSRGLAIAGILSGTGVATITTPIIAQYMVSEYGWRAAYLALGAGWGLLAIPVIIWGFHGRPEQGGRRSRTDAIVGTGVTLREGYLSTAFLRLALGIFAMTLASIAVIINFVPILRSHGLTIETAAMLAGLQGVAAVVGRLTGGYLLDLFSARLVAAVAVMLPAACALVLLAAPGFLPAAIAATILLGLASGAELDAVSYMSSRYFGQRNFGTLFGTLTGLMTLAVGIGPLVANHVYDVVGSYDAVLWSVVPMSILTALLFGTAGPYPEFPVEATDR